MRNPTLLQCFHWYYPAGGELWLEAAALAPSLNEIGINMIWLPPACKGASGGYSVGYDSYDLFDLGEFDQKGTVATKYGDKSQLLAAIDALKQHDIAVLMDVGASGGYYIACACDEIIVHRFSYGAPYGWTDIASLQVSGTTLKATAISRPGTYMGWFGRNVNDSIPGTLSGNVDGDSAGEFVITSGWGYAVIERQGTSFVAISGAPFGSVSGEWINRSSQGFLGFVDLDGNGRTELLVRD